MTDQGPLATLASHAFLSGLSERHRMLLASGVRPFSAAPKEILARERETAKTLYLIQSGHVSLNLSVPGRGLVRFQTVGPDEIVGWSWLVPPHKWQFNCDAIDEVKGLAFDAVWLRERCDQDHELGYQLLKQLVSVIANRLTATRVQLLDIYK